VKIGNQELLRLIYSLLLTNPHYGMLIDSRMMHPTVVWVSSCFPTGTENISLRLDDRISKGEHGWEESQYLGQEDPLSCSSIAAPARLGSRKCYTTLSEALPILTTRDKLDRV